MAQDLNRSIKIYIDNSDALAKAENLENRIASLRSELQKLDAEGKRDSKQHDATQKALQKLERTYGTYQNKIQETQRVLKNLSGSTYKELLAVRRELQRELRNEQRGTETYTAKLKAYQAVQKELTVAQRELNGTLGAQSSLWSRATNSFNKYFGIVSAFAASVTGLSLAFRKLSQDAAAMEDVYADVMKTTGMTRDEVEDLNTAFKSMSTRTSREELNNLARDAGKLGLTSRKDILDFVEAGNQINVALGEDLGEGAIKNIGKMTDVFKLSTKELKNMDLKEQMLSIGSAINELGQSSTASESYLVSFSQRLGGVASQAGISIQDILGYASALDQSGQAVEMSATAFQKFVMQLMGDTEKFARIAGIEVEKFNTILKEDTNEAIKTVLKALSQKGGFQDLIPVFQEMGLDGARAVGVLSSLATNIGKVDEAQTIANDAFRESISLTNEYNTKNENAQAELEKHRKAFKDAALELGERLNPAMLKSTSLITFVVKLMPPLLDFLEKYGKYLLYLATVYLAYNISIKANIALKQLELKTRLQLIAMAVKERASMVALNLQYIINSRSISQLSRSFRALFVTMGLNPVAAVTALIVGLGIAIYQLMRRTTQYTDKAKAMEDINKRVASAVAAERSELKLLLGVAQNESISKEKRIKAIKKLNEISPEYLGNLSLENINTTEATTAVENYTTALMENAKQKAIGDKVTELNAKRLELEAKLIREQEILDRRRNAGIKQSDIDRIHQDEVNRINERISLIDQEIDVYDTLNQKIIASMKKPDEINNDAPGGGGGGNSDGDKDKDIYKIKLAELQNYINQEKNLLLQSLLDKQITQEAYNRQMEHLERERLQKTLEIYQIEPAKRIEVENLILENKIKALQAIEDAERKHQEKLTKMQADAEKARAENNYDALKEIARQNDEQWKQERQKQNEQKAALVAVSMDMAGEMGSLLGGVISGNEDLVSSSLKSIVNMALDTLKLQVQMSVAGATAMSLAQPDSVATFGASGFARAAILVGLIEAAFSAVKGVVNAAIGNIGGSKSSGSAASSSSSSTTRRVVNQRARGKYDVIGGDDGRHYSVPYLGVASTGMVASPALVGEYGPELIVSAPDFGRLQRHINYPLVLQAIQDSRVPQRAEGNYSPLPPAPISTNSTTVQLDREIANEILRLLQYLNQNGVSATVNYHQFERAQRTMADIRARAGR